MEMETQSKKAELKRVSIMVDYSTVASLNEDLTFEVKVKKIGGEVNILAIFETLKHLQQNN